MKPTERNGLYLVLASRRAFEAFVGSVPEAIAERFRFLKPGRAAQIRGLLPECRLVISKSYRRAEINRWIFEARRLGVPTLLLVDGPFEWANLYRKPSLASLRARIVVRGLFEPIAHDAVATIGEAQTDWIAQRNPDRGVVFMSYSNRRIRNAQAERPVAADADWEFDFLVTTAKTPWFDERERTALLAVLSACGRALEAAGHRTLVRIFDDDLRDTIRSAAPSCRFDTEGSFGEALARSRCVLGTPSSVILEAMQHDRPTGLLMFRDSPLFYQTGWLLGCQADWTQSFRSMLAREPQRMALQRDTLRANVSEQDFFEHCERIDAGDLLAAPRPFDAADLAFENQVLHQVFGWRARWLARLLRAVSTGSSKDRSV